MTKGVLLFSLFLTGCSTLSPQRGGVATIGKAILSPFKALSAMEAQPQPAKQKAAKAKESVVNEGLTITQPDNPEQQSAQNYDFTREDEIIFSTPTQIKEVMETERGTVTRTIDVPAGSKKVSREVQKVGQVLGASQKDTGRELAAKLGSFKGVQLIGTLCLLAGVLCFFHPALRVVVGGKDTAMALGGAGLIMVFGPSLFVAYEKYFLLSIVAAGLYWFWSRSKYKEATLDALKEKDPNNER